MDNKLEIREAIFGRTLQNKLYELYPYSSISIYRDEGMHTATLEMLFYWKGKRLGLRHEVLLIAIEHYDLSELIRISILEIQERITERILREGADNDTSRKES